MTAKFIFPNDSIPFQARTFSGAAFPSIYLPFSLTLCRARISSRFRLFAVCLHLRWLNSLFFSLLLLFCVLCVLEKTECERDKENRQQRQQYETIFRTQAHPKYVVMADKISLHNVDAFHYQRTEYVDEIYLC